jgi:hypothetical protein
VEGVDPAEWLVRSGLALDWPKYSNGKLLANPVEQLLEKPAFAIQYGEALVQLFNAAAQKQLGMPLISLV